MPPFEHATPHWPPAHTAVDPAAAGHAWPQTPQLATSVSRSTHPEGQGVSGGLHVHPGPVQEPPAPLELAVEVVVPTPAPPLPLLPLGPAPTPRPPDPDGPEQSVWQVPPPPPAEEQPVKAAATKMATKMFVVRLMLGS